MATSPNFGWLEPDNTDLVKNGALAIRTAVDAIDSSMADLKGGTTGQVLSKTSNTDMDFTWVAQDDSNAIQNAIVDAKGDLIAATAADTPARLAVGTNGQVLTADSTASTGLAWTTVSGSPTSYGFAAGKNKVINGDFNVWQRGTTLTSQYGYVSDRWIYYQNGSGGVTTSSQQTFTPGNTISGYEPSFFLRVNQTTAGTGATTNSILTNLEDVRTLAGQTATISFWAKAGSGTPSITPGMFQTFGTGGSAQVATSYTAIPITTSWARYTQTISIPSISGKTIGTNSYVTLNLAIPVNTVQTIDFWGVQLEAGSTATDFQTATGTLQGELALCQRYYWRTSNSAVNNANLGGTGFTYATTAGAYWVNNPVAMRITPYAVDAANLRVYDITGAAAYTATATISTDSTPINGVINFAVTGATANRVVRLDANTTGGYLGFSAEL